MISTQDLLKNFNPNDHIMQIESGPGDKKKKSDYLPVQWRLVWFRALCPQGTIKTEMSHLDLEAEFEGEKWVWDTGLRKNVKVPCTGKGIAIFRAIVEDGQGGIATGTKSEKSVDFADFIEKAETGAIGRALAALGYGTQFTGDELNEGERIADSPVDNGASKPRSEPQRPTPVPNNSPATDQQKSGINRLCELMDKAPDLPADATFDQAALMLKQLSEEYKGHRKKAS